MKIWKRNAIVATVLVLICVGVYLNWDKSNRAVDLTETLNSEYLMEDTVLTMGAENDISLESEEISGADYFAQIRLSRQESRDSAVELLQQTIAYEENSEDAAAAVSSLDCLVGEALAESEIESLLIAKGYRDCVAYMSEGTISVAVAADETGLGEEDIALISDIVTTQTEYKLNDIRIIEVK